MQSNGPVSTEKQAIKTALPLVQKCAKENNFAITTTKATLIIDSTLPYWFVEFELKPKDYTPSDIPSCAYEVAVWADTGKIYHHGQIQIGSLPNSINYDEKDFNFSLVNAIETAYPLVQEYAQENNRTLATGVVVRAFYVDSRPTWQIDVLFEPIKNHPHAFLDHPYGVYAYGVTVWADTGEIRSTSEQGWM